MTKKDLINIGRRICRARKEKHMTQEELANAIDRTAVYIGMIERGQRVPSLETFMDIAEALGVSADYILCDAVSYGYKIRLAEYEERIAALTKKDKERISRVMDAFLGES